MDFRSCSFLLFTTLASACVADTSDATQASAVRDHRRPPREAVEACKGSAARAACAFDVGDHHVTGTCRTPPDGTDGPLACAPGRPPPPPEALAVCAGTAAGAACAFEIDGHHVDGTCKLSPDGNAPLACAPNDPPPLRRAASP